ncbi:Acetylornithine/succinyldiaminopimelate aminotransferase [Streptomyces antimycoticus]
MTAAEQQRRSGFDLGKLLAERASERYDLHTRHLNHQLPRMLQTIGFDKVYERGEGAYFWDDEGQDYLDMLAGFGVMGLGRHHPVVRKALHDVLDADLADLTRFDCQPLPGLLAERLLAHAPHLDRVFFGNSGTEAVETALKFARYATRKPRILYCAHAFHGLTTGSLSVNGEDGFREGFAPLLPDTAIEMGDLDALERELARGDVAAFVVEPIQGKGVHETPPGFLRAAQELLHRHKALPSRTRCRPASAAPNCSPTATRTVSNRIWCAWPRPSPAAMCRSARPSARTGSSGRSTPRWTGCWSTRPASAPTPRPWRPGSPSSPSWRTSRSWPTPVLEAGIGAVAGRYAGWPGSALPPGAAGPGVQVMEVESWDPTPRVTLTTPAFTVKARHDLLRRAELFGLRYRPGHRARPLPGDQPGRAGAVLRRAVHNRLVQRRGLLGGGGDRVLHGARFGAAAAEGEADQRAVRPAVRLPGRAPRHRSGADGGLDHRARGRGRHDVVSPEP